MMCAQVVESIRYFSGSQQQAKSSRCALLAAWLILYVLAVTEYGAGVLVAPPGASILAVFTVNQAHYGPGPVLTGLFVLLLGVVALPFVVWGLGRGVRGLWARWA